MALAHCLHSALLGRQQIADVVFGLMDNIAIKSIKNVHKLTANIAEEIIGNGCFLTKDYPWHHGLCQALREA